MMPGSNPLRKSIGLSDEGRAAVLDVAVNSRWGRPWTERESERCEEGEYSIFFFFTIRDPIPIIRPDDDAT